jgi:hypothetical protein
MNEKLIRKVSKGADTLGWLAAADALEERGDVASVGRAGRLRRRAEVYPLLLDAVRACDGRAGSYWAPRGSLTFGPDSGVRLGGGRRWIILYLWAGTFRCPWRRRTFRRRVATFKLERKFLRERPGYLEGRLIGVADKVAECEETHAEGLAKQSA